MKRVIIICVLCVFNLVLVSAKDKPNVVFILVDDISWSCFSIYGSQTYNTPKIDSLGKEGMMFEYAYTQPNCTPTRVKLMTGKYNFRNYISFGKLKEGEKTIGNLAKQAGYTTAIAGKWQLGYGADNTALIKEFGFDEYCLHSIGEGGSRYWNPSFVENGKKHMQVGKYGPDFYSDFICDFIRRSKDKKFFVYYPMVLMHSPYVPTPDSPKEMIQEYLSQVNKVVEESRGKEPKRGKLTYEEQISRVTWKDGKVDGYPEPHHTDKQSAFEDMMSYMDKIVGKIYNTLEEEGVLDNTVIIFTADNGNSKDTYSYINSEKLYGAKGSMVDLGTRVPLLVYWKDKAKKGYVSKRMVDACDYYSTLADIMGVDIAQEVNVDGISFVDSIEGKVNLSTQRKYVISHWTPYKGTSKGIRFVRKMDYKLYENGNFYNVSKDMHEKHKLKRKDSPEDYDELKKLISSLPPLPEKAGSEDKKNAKLYDDWKINIPLSEN